MHAAFAEPDAFRHLVHGLFDVSAHFKLLFDLAARMAKERHLNEEQLKLDSATAIGELEVMTTATANKGKLGEN